MKAASQNLNIDEKQAEQFVFKFGLSKDKLEGQVLRALQPSVDQLVVEIEKSVKFFQTKYPSVPIGGLILSNYGVTVAGFSDYVSQKLGIRSELGNPWQRVRVSSTDQANLQQLSSQFAVAIGLAQRGGE